MKVFQRLLTLTAFALLLSAPQIKAQAIDDLFSSDEIATSVTLPEVDKQPKPITQSKPELKGDLSDMTGFAKVAFIIDAQGNVVNPRIQSSSDARLEDPTIEAVSKWRFEPASKDGSAVAVRVVLPFRFTGR